MLNRTHCLGMVQCWALFCFAGRITNPPWGAPLRSRIHNPAGFTMPAPILKRTRTQGGCFNFGQLINVVGLQFRLESKNVHMRVCDSLA